MVIANYHSDELIPEAIDSDSKIIIVIGGILETTKYEMILLSKV